MTETYESILALIYRDFDGLKAAIIAMLAGESVKVKTRSYQNDMISFKNKDDVLTALIHLGYLAYDQRHGAASINSQRRNSLRIYRGGGGKSLERSDVKLRDLKIKEDAVQGRVFLLLSF